MQNVHERGSAVRGIEIYDIVKQISLMLTIQASEL